MEETVEETVKETDLERQVRIMELQLSAQTTLFDKVRYLTKFFDPDPDFSQEARDIIRANLCNGEKKSND